MAMQGLNAPALARNQSKNANTNKTKLALPAAHASTSKVKSSQLAIESGAAAPKAGTVASPRAFGGVKPNGSTLASAINRSQTAKAMPNKSNSGSAGKQPVGASGKSVQGFSTGGALKGIV